MLSELARLADLTLCELRAFEILMYRYTLRFQNPLRLAPGHLFAQTHPPTGTDAVLRQEKSTRYCDCVAAGSDGCCATGTKYIPPFPVGADLCVCPFLRLPGRGCKNRHAGFFLFFFILCLPSPRVLYSSTFPLRRGGRVWLKAHAWKACVP